MLEHIQNIRFHPNKDLRSQTKFEVTVVYGAEGTFLQSIMTDPTSRPVSRSRRSGTRSAHGNDDYAYGHSNGSMYRRDSNISEFVEYARLDPLYLLS